MIDIKGLAIPDAVVTWRNQSDTTDSNGYFAIRTPLGGVKIMVTHLATNYPIEIDTNQNWNIVLDIAEQKILDYTPMNAANRFK